VPHQISQHWVLVFENNMRAASQQPDDQQERIWDANSGQLLEQQPDDQQERI
jgi:hypothetical protein